MDVPLPLRGVDVQGLLIHTNHAFHRGKVRAMSLDQQIKRYQKAFQEDRLSKPVRCRSCGREGTLHWHAVYRRSLITFNDPVVIPVRRVLCSVCRKTFTILPEFVLKFHRYAKAVVDLALQKRNSLSYDAVADFLMDRCHRCVAVFTLHLWRRRFQTS
ncbi:MAG: hypothetical protein IPN90_11740 [Elusimicrobia bacterium]|nr:hypothetical protein [Elusimicrobiota bacterium]